MSTAAPKASILDGLLALSDNEAQLRSNESEADFFTTWPWFELLSEAGLDRDAPRRLVHIQTAEGEFCLPLLRQPSSASAALGGATTGLSNYYSSLFGPLGNANAVTVPALRMGLRALSAADGWPGVLDLQPLDAQAPFITAMESALAAEGYATHRYFCFGNWHLPVSGRSFASYEKTLPSRLRNTIKRGRKKLDGAGVWTLHVHQAPGAALDNAIADFESIYAKSWKVPEPFPKFVPSLCRMAAAHGWLRLGVLRFEDKPIASQLWIVKDGRALIYKLAYNEDYKRFSAGSVLSGELMRHAIDDDRVQDVDYLTGDDGYKVDWMSHRRERMGLVGFRRASLSGSLALLKHRAGRLRARWTTRPVPAAADSAAGSAAETDRQSGP